METRLVLGILLVFALAIAFGCSGVGSSPGDVVKQYVAALSACDTNKLVDLSYLPEERDAAVMKSELESLCGMMKLSDATVTVKSEQIQGDDAFVEAQVCGTGTAFGYTRTGCNLATFGLKRKNGEWKVASMK